MVGKLFNFVFLFVLGELLDVVYGYLWVVVYEDGFIVVLCEVFVQCLSVVCEGVILKVGVGILCYELFG